MDKFQDSKNNHLALAQYYRWYQVYETPFTKATTNNQLDILSDDVEVTSQAGTSRGKDAIVERLKSFEGWKNAHHVKNTKVISLDDNTLKLEADILFQNIRPDDKRYSYTIHYSILLQKRDNDLPIFTSVNLQPTGAIVKPQFLSAYSENRVASFLHYWLYLMETIDTNADKFEELLAKNFGLNLNSSTKITTLDAFKEWAKTAQAGIKSIAYKPKNIVVKENHDKTISVSIDVESQAISKDDKPMMGKTRQEWTLENDTEERFAKMKTMKVVENNKALRS